MAISKQMNLSRQLQVRLTPELADQLTAAARRSGLDNAGFVRQLIAKNTQTPQADGAGIELTFVSIVTYGSGLSGLDRDGRCWEYHKPDHGFSGGWVLMSMRRL